MDIKFSIVIPVYNVEKYIKQCVESVLLQTYKEYEMILVNDGSKDLCGIICDNYAQKDERIRVIHKKNGGLSSARNAGLDIATGEYILFLDSDDYWDDPMMLQKIYESICETKCDIYIFGMKKFFQSTGKYEDREIKIEKGGKVFSIDSIQPLMENNLLIACACDKVVSRELIEENHIRFRLGQMSEDIEWNVKLLLYGQSIGVIYQSFYVYRQENESSITANIKRKNMEDILEIIERYAETDDIAIRHYIANQYVLWMTTSNRIKNKEIKDLLLIARKYWYLLGYDWYPYVKKVNILKRIGFNGVRVLLKIYRKIKLG
jgi:glycosyltransferase involved in cell wall biosynthesis